MRSFSRTLALVLVVPTIESSMIGSARSQMPGRNLDERRYVELVLRSGLEARVAEAEATLGQVEAVGAGAWGNPTLGWQRESVESGPAARATQDIFLLSLPLILSGRLGLERVAARESGQAALARRERARAELRHEAVRRFYAAVAATEKKTVIAESLARLRQLSETIAAREKAGDASGYDRLRIGVEAASVADLMHGAVIAEGGAQAAALALLGPEHEALPPLEASLATLPGRTEGTPGSQGLEARRADLHALGLEARAAETARRAASRGILPDLNFQAGVQLLDAGRPGESRGYVAGVELPLPLFQRRQGERARAAARRDLAETRASALLRQARTRLAAARTAAAESRVRHEAHRKEVLARAEELRRIAGAAYRGGASDLLALVDAERMARQARLDAIDLAEAVIAAESELLLVAGAYEKSQTGSKTP